MARNREPDPLGQRTMDLPIIDTPLSRIGEHWANSQRTSCAAWEIDYMRCASAVGELRARTECKRYLDDFLECRDQTKTLKRYEAMMIERKRQGRPMPPKPAGDTFGSLAGPM